MIVVDASVLANVVGDDDSAGRSARARLDAAGEASAPDLIDVETVSVLRRRWLAGDLSDRRFRDAVADLGALPLTCYVALAETLRCPLLTADARLASAPTITCTIDVLRA